MKILEFSIALCIIVYSVLLYTVERFTLFVLRGVVGAAMFYGAGRSR